MNPLPYNDVEYADDTVILALTIQHAQRLITAVEERAREDNMTLNARKNTHLTMQHKRIGPQPPLYAAGQIIKQKHTERYLGNDIHTKHAFLQRSRYETTQRLAQARKRFGKLTRLWRHTNYSRKQKYNKYWATVVQQLVYGIPTLVIAKADMERLNAFHVRCLRIIYGIQPTYVTKHVLPFQDTVPNHEVYRIAKTYPLQVFIQEQQIKLYAHIYRRPADHIIKMTTFHEDTLKEPLCRLESELAPSNDIPITRRKETP